MKKCPYCGRMTSAKANFCWWCARELTARPERPDPTPEKKGGIPFVWIGLGLLLAAGLAWVLLAR